MGEIKDFDTLSWARLRQPPQLAKVRTICDKEKATPRERGLILLFEF